MKKIFLSFSILYIIFFFLLITFFPLTNASTKELIQLYNFDFNSDNSIVILNKTDYMSDTNNNKINDTLFFDISLKVNTKGLYYFYIDLEDSNNILTTKVIKNITQDTQTITLNFSTHLLSQSQFNYSIKIYNKDNMLVFRKFRQQTKNYQDYETDFQILKISDENINNEFIRIYLTINSTKKSIQNISAILQYKNNPIISNKEIKINKGQNNISIDFNNSLIKNTHYKGSYLLTKIIIGEKIINSNYTTAQYNFEDFAKTSYIKSYSNAQINLNNDSLIDYIQINLTLNIKKKGNYTIEYQLFDLFENFVAFISTKKYFEKGINILETKINGSEVYKSKTSSPYIIKFSKIKNNKNKVIDNQINPYELKIQNLSYTEFVRSALPDLTIKIKHIKPENLINVTITNIGSSPAFNIFIDLFNNKSYYNQTSYFMLDVNQSKTFNFKINKTENNTLFTAIVDFQNLIDELNESNNIADNIKIEKTIPNDTKKFYIRNIFGNPVAWFGNWGNIVLKGKCIISKKCTPPKNSFIIANKTDYSTAYIDFQGNLCIEKGNCKDKASKCNPKRNAFIIKNSSNDNMSYIDFDGELCLIGELFENINITL